MEFKQDGVGIQLLLLHGTAYGSMGGTCTRRKTSGTDGRLLLYDRVHLLFHPYITRGKLTANIPLHSVECWNVPSLAVRSQQKVWRFSTLRLGQPPLNFPKQLQHFRRISISHEASPRNKITTFPCQISWRRTLKAFHGFRMPLKVICINASTHCNATDSK